MVALFRRRLVMVARIFGFDRAGVLSAAMMGKVSPTKRRPVNECGVYRPLAFALSR